jgi:argininosuccinate lyase
LSFLTGRACRAKEEVFMAQQLWKGRFSKAVDARVNDFNSSIRFDQRMIAEDMRGSAVHAAMLAKQGILSQADCDAIQSGLAGIADDLESGALAIDPAAEDVHTFVEQTLTARIGDAGKRLHTGRSRNDQVALDLRLWMRGEAARCRARSSRWMRVLCEKAGENTASVMPGYTHLQRAQPITFGHALMAYAWMLLRDLERLAGRGVPHGQPVPAGLGRPRGHHLPAGPRVHRAEARLLRPLPQLARRRVRPRLRDRVCQRPCPSA